MRILFVTDLRYPPQNAVGGARVSTHQLCELLSQRGHTVAVLCKLERRSWLGLWNRLKSKAFHLKYPADRTLGYPVYRGYDAIHGIPEVVHRFTPDVAVAGTASTFLISRALIRQNIPVAAYIRSLEFEKMGEPLSTDPRLLVLSNSMYTARVVQRRFGLRSEIIPPLVIPNLYKTTSERKTVLHVNPDRSKGIDITLALARRRPDIPFDVLRSWPVNDYDQIQAEASDLPNVTWHEPVSDMRPFYRQAKILIAPSQWDEAWGRVVTEAHVNGIPVLASDRGGLPESVGSGGEIVPANAEIEEWEHALARMWDDQAAYNELSQQALNHSERPEILPNQLISTLEGALRNHSRNNPSSSSPTSESTKH